MGLTHSQVPWQDADAERRRLGARSAPIRLDALQAYFNDPHDISPVGEAGEPQVDEAAVAAFLEEARTYSGRPVVTDDLTRLRALAATR